MQTTLGKLAEATGFEILEHLEAEAAVPVLDGLQAQGDLFIVPVPVTEGIVRGDEVPLAGVAVIEAMNGGHEHRLFASEPGTTSWSTQTAGEQLIGWLECTAPAYVLHPEHGAAGIAPGRYELRRQREQADEQRLVAD